MDFIRYLMENPWDPRISSILSENFQEIFLQNGRDRRPFCRKSSWKSSDRIENKVSAKHTGAGSPGASPGPAQSGPGWHTAEAGPGLGPDQAGSHESNIFSEICLPWFETEASFRIEIWTRQYRQIVQNFDPRLMELALEALDIIRKSKKME